MAQRDKHLVGLDIEHASITAVEVAVNGRLAVRTAARAKLEEGIMRDGELVDSDGLTAALRALWRDHKGLGKRVRIGVANQKIVVRAIEVPPTKDRRELDAVVRFQAQDSLPMSLESAVLDYVPLNSVDNGAGERQRVLLVAARRDVVERLVNAVSRAGLKPAGIDLSAFAMVRALSSGAPADEHVLYLCVSGTTNLAVAQGSTCLFTRVSGAGIETLSVELAERQGLTLDHAQAWLSHVGLEAPLESIEGDPDIVKEARHVLLDGARRIASDVRNSLDFHTMSGATSPITCAVLTGAAMDVPGFAAALQSEMSMPVEARGVPGGPDAIEPGRLTVAAGLAVSEVPA
ncbi:MAG TPA: type IV pilus assembly protein PilM [Solirubrobacteraceae bacterium]